MASVVNRVATRRKRQPLTTSWVEFMVSPDHATVTNYQVRLHDPGVTGVNIATQDLGKPAQYKKNVIAVDLTPLYTGVDPGNYTITIAATNDYGTTDSGESDAFTLPLA